MKKIKIVSILGLVSMDVDMIVKLINVGVNIFWFNFFYGDYLEYFGWIENVYKVEEIIGKYVGIMFDIKGVEIWMIV